MDANNYIETRLNDQIKWYSKKSGIYKKRYQALRVIVIAISVLLPFLTGIMSDKTPYVKIAIGIGSLIIAFFEGLTSLYRFQEQWIAYRETSEALKREKIYFQTQTGPYQDQQTKELLVTRSEAIMSGENKNWSSLISDNK